MRAAFVVQRYGSEVVGGAEHICRQLAERLSRRVRIEVLTTCALDYMSWANHYTPGREVIGSVPVLRFPVDAPRDVARFNRLSERIVSGNEDEALQTHWMREQGPYAPPLFEYLAQHSSDYDVVVFFTYLYASTYFGLEQVSDRAVLVPCAHEEPWIRLQLFRKMFQMPQAFVFQTEEERDLVCRLFSVADAPHRVAGAGVSEPRTAPDAERFWQSTGRAMQRDTPLLVYLGRVDASKGCDVLLDHFRRFRADVPELPVQLALVGPLHMEVPCQAEVTVLGMVPEDRRYDALAAADIVVNPSPHESLSLTVLESWSVARPALVNGSCAVLRGQCQRSNGGLYYQSYAEFRETMRFLLANRDTARQLGKQGQQYVLSRYQWADVEAAYLGIMQQVVAANSARRAAGEPGLAPAQQADATSA